LSGLPRFRACSGFYASSTPVCRTLLDQLDFGRHGSAGVGRFRVFFKAEETSFQTLLKHDEIAEGTLLQGGRGVDHIVIAVKSLDSSTKSYGETLGFTMMPGGRHPWGTENSTARFENDSYLELLSLYDPSKHEALSSFLEKHEGGLAVGLNTSSAELSASFLKSRGVETRIEDRTIKFEGMPDPPPVFWHSIELKEGTAASDTIFLTEYTLAREAYQKEHPEHYGKKKHANTAKRLASALIAVRDIDEAVKRYERIGLTPTKRTDIPIMNARGAVLNAGQGSILLLSPIESKGPILRFLMQRGEGVIGASIEVASLDTLTGILAHSGIRSQKYTGINGDSVMVEPEHGHGLRLEMFQSSR
jgi:catechol 2,3-dioxygenase-like lactoylglutathione lyase family enzyme